MIIIYNAFPILIFSLYPFLWQGIVDVINILILPIYLATLNANWLKKSCLLKKTICYIWMFFVITISYVIEIIVSYNIFKINIIESDILYITIFYYKISLFVLTSVLGFYKGFTECTIIYYLLLLGLYSCFSMTITYIPKGCFRYIIELFFELNDFYIIHFCVSVGVVIWYFCHKHSFNKKIKFITMLINFTNIVLGVIYVIGRMY